MSPQADSRALHAARHHERTEGFTTTYARRAGIEGTLSRGVRQFACVGNAIWGQAQAHLGHVSTAVGRKFPASARGSVMRQGHIYGAHPSPHLWPTHRPT